jgi:soluble cytochrome b562
MEALIHKDECQSMLRDMEEHLNSQRGQLVELEIEDGEDFATEDHFRLYNLHMGLVASAQTAVDEAKALKKAADKELREAKSRLKTLEDNNTEYGKTTRDLWMSVQRMLKDQFSIHPSSYHGGDMEGNQCRRLMTEAPKVMAAVEDILLAHLNSLGAEERAKRANEAEVKLFCKGFQYIFQHMDLLSHFAYQPAGTLTDVNMVDVQKCVDRLTALWKKLMPTIPVKVHSWQHLVEDLERLRGMKEYDDSGIEVYHQVMKKHHRRVGNLGNFEKKINSILKAGGNLWKETSPRGGGHGGGQQEEEQEDTA